MQFLRSKYTTRMENGKMGDGRERVGRGRGGIVQFYRSL